MVRGAPDLGLDRAFGRVRVVVTSGVWSAANGVSGCFDIITDVCGSVVLDVQIDRIDAGLDAARSAPVTECLAQDRPRRSTH